MKLTQMLQLTVLFCLLFAATICLRLHKPDDFSRIENQTLYAQAITKLEKQSPSENKQNLVEMFKRSFEAEASALSALKSNAELFEGLGYFLLFCACLQGLGVYYSWRQP